MLRVSKYYKRTVVLLRHRVHVKMGQLHKVSIWKEFTVYGQKSFTFAQ